MRYNIKNMKSLEQLKEYLKEHYQGKEKEDASFVNYVIEEWDNGNLSRKFIEFHEEELAQQIDAINPNQSKSEICEDIIKIILDEQSEISLSSNDTNQSFLGEFLDYLLSHPGTRHI